MTRPGATLGGFQNRKKPTLKTRVSAGPAGKIQKRIKPAGIYGGTRGSVQYKLNGEMKKFYCYRAGSIPASATKKCS
jgi:hypothetical protein